MRLAGGEETVACRIQCLFSSSYLCSLHSVTYVLGALRWGGGVGGSDHDGALLMLPSIPGNSGHVSLREG